jgi:glutaminyl-tRNA synthetase
VRSTYDPDTKSGTPGADKVKVKGNIHWVSAQHAYAAEVRLYDRLFKVPHPGKSQKAFPPPRELSPLPLAGEGQGEGDWLADLNPDSKKIITAQLEPALGEARPEEQFQFERHGYFLADRVDSKPGAPTFNRAVTHADSWAESGGDG